MTESQSQDFSGIDFVGTFTGQINTRTSDSVLSNLVTAAKGNASSVRLLFSSSGGHIDQALGLFDVISNFPIPLIMHNIGVVASAGVFVFLGAQYRTCHSEALFLMHRHFWALDEATKIDSKDISELHLVSNAIRERSLSILQRQLGANREIAERLSSESRIIGADEAKSLGIVHNIERTSIPTGPALFHIPSDP